MRDKIVNLMKSEGLTSSRLAELLETQPSAISHLMSGRNKPSFDLLQKILRRFPKINPDWLLLDSDQMYRNDSLESLPDSSEPTPTLDENSHGDLFSVSEDLHQNSTPNLSSIFGSSDSLMSSSNSSPSARRSAVVERVVVFYSDMTFVSYDMRK